MTPISFIIILWTLSIYSAYIRGIFEIADDKHGSLPLPVNIAESSTLGSEIHQSSPLHLLRERLIAPWHAAIGKVLTPALESKQNIAIDQRNFLLYL